MPINGHGQNMLSGGNNGLLNVCVNNANNANNTTKVWLNILFHFALYPLNKSWNNLKKEKKNTNFEEIQIKEKWQHFEWFSVQFI